MKRLTQAELDQMIQNGDTNFNKMVLDGLSFDDHKDKLTALGEDCFILCTFKDSILRNMHIDLTVIKGRFNGAEIENCTFEDDGVTYNSFTHGKIKDSRFVLAECVKEVCNIKSEEDISRGLRQWMAQPGYNCIEGSNLQWTTITNTVFEHGLGHHCFRGTDMKDCQFLNSYYRSLDFESAKLVDVVIKDCELYTVNHMDKYQSWIYDGDMLWPCINFSVRINPHLYPNGSAELNIITVSNVTLYNPALEKRVVVNTMEDLKVQASHLTMKSIARVADRVYDKVQGDNVTYAGKYARMVDGKFLTPLMSVEDYKDWCVKTYGNNPNVYCNYDVKLSTIVSKYSRSHSLADTIAYLSATGFNETELIALITKYDPRAIKRDNQATA